MSRGNSFWLIALVTVGAFVVILQTQNSNHPYSQFRQEQETEIDPEKRIVELGLKLPEPSASLAIYKKLVIVGNTA